MSAKLEEYLRKSRKEIDVESPDDSEIWNRIQSKRNIEIPDVRDFNRRSRFLKIRNIAAAAIILFSMGYIANDIINARFSAKNLTLSSIDSELGKRENDYKTLVNFKTDEVKSFSNSNDKIINQLFDEIKNLDFEYAQALADLKILGPNEKVINTIFNTYEQKISLLELIILEKNKQNSHEKNEKIIL